MAGDVKHPVRTGEAGRSQRESVAFSVTDPDFGKSPFTGMTRRHWLDAARFLTEGVFRHVHHMDDPQHRREEEIFSRLGYIDAQHLAPRIQARVMMAVTLNDTICPPSTQFAAYNHLQSGKSVEPYPDFGHEAPPGFAEKTFKFMMEMR